MTNQSLPPPKSSTTFASDVGRFMIAVGAIIKHPTTEQILVMKRFKTDHLAGQWELLYGRISHQEEILTGLKREIAEESGLSADQIEIQKLLRLWHVYRGQPSPKTELYGLTFVCQATSDQIMISDEHSAFQWVSPSQALELIKISGIRKDVETYLEFLKSPRPASVTISNLAESEITRL